MKGQGRIVRAKFLTFQRPDGTVIDIDVPDNWDQRFVKRVNASEYTIHFVVTGKIPAEADFCKVAVGKGHTCGYAIPGSAILSADLLATHSDDKTYCAYNLLIADAICRDSKLKNYELANKQHASATTRSGIFRQDGFYLAIWNSQLAKPLHFKKDFAISLSSHGLIFPVSEHLPTQLIATPPIEGETLRLKATTDVPGYIRTILGSLVPYCENPFLRFFYLYQIIEHLMGEDFYNRVAEVRTRFVANDNPSKVELRDILEKFQDATREKARINIVLSPECSTTRLAVDSLLSDLNINEPDTTFAERIYRVRNTLFHDYGVLHAHGNAVSLISDGLYSYLMKKKILVE